MAYSDKDDVIDLRDAAKVLEMLDDAGGGTWTAAIEASLVRIIEMADREIDNYVSAKYTVPISIPSAFITKISATIAIYHLYGRRDKDDWDDRYNAVIEQLEGIKDGTIDLSGGGIIAKTDPGISFNKTTDDRKHLTPNGYYT